MTQCDIIYEVSFFVYQNEMSHDCMRTKVYHHQWLIPTLVVRYDSLEGEMRLEHVYAS